MALLCYDKAKLSVGFSLNKDGPKLLMCFQLSSDDATPKLEQDVYVCCRTLYATLLHAAE